MSQLRVSLVRGLSGQTGRQRLCIKGLGLKRLHQSVVVIDTPSNRGLVAKVAHLVKVEALEG